ncbi:MAG: hypothetical protein KGQ59_06140 [Bdellovibrionales bacterium]|nr:hypothetical protein [Bdellovibrionales bacterium]
MRQAFGIVVSLLVSGSSVAWAGGPTLQPLLKMTVSSDPGARHDVVLNLDRDGNLVSMVRGKDTYSLRQLRRGVVLDKRALTIETMRITTDEKFSAISGGSIVLRYLKNFNPINFRKEYAEFRMELVREGDHWVLRDEKHQNFDVLHAVAQADGIKSLIPINASGSTRIQELIQASQPQDHLQDPAESDARISSVKSPTIVASAQYVSKPGNGQIQSASAR